MAEIVYKNLESMLPEVEELERQEIFTAEELKVAIKRRTEYEYKLQKRTTCKQDILNYIEYESKFAKLLRKRLKSMKHKELSKATLSLNARIHSLFDKALLKFSNDLSIWLQYIEFCKKTNAKRSLSKAFGKLIQKHAHNEEVWLLAAKHQVEYEQNMDAARSLLQKALRQHKESQNLWIEYFKLELLHVRKIKKRRDLLGVGAIDLKEADGEQPKQIDSFMHNKTAEIVYKNSLKQIPGDVSFRLKYLEVCKTFENTDNLQGLVMNDLENDFSQNEDIRQMFCKKCLKNTKKGPLNEEDWEGIEKELVSNFDEAVRSLNTDTMWEKYVESLGELLTQSKTSAQTARRFGYLNQLMQRVEAEGKLNVEIVLFWVDILMEVEESDALLSYLEKYIEIYPKEVSLWLKYLAVKAQLSDSWEDLQENFKIALRKLDEKDDLPLWEMYIDLATDMEFGQTKAVFEEIIGSSRRELRNHLLVRYLDWLHEHKGIKATRKLYKRFLGSRMELEFLYHCIQIEEAQKQVGVKEIRKLHEKIIDDYGLENTDVWISFICFERKYNKYDIDASSKIYLRARNTLKGNLNEEFITKYALFQTN